MLIAGEPDVDNITSPCVARVNRARRPTHIAPSPAQTRDPYHPDSSPPLSPDGPCSSQLTGSSEDRHTSIGPWQPNWSRSQHLSQHRDTLPVPIAGSGAESSADLATRRIPTVGRYVLDWVGGVQDQRDLDVPGTRGNAPRGRPSARRLRQSQRRTRWAHRPNPRGEPRRPPLGSRPGLFVPSGQRRPGLERGDPQAAPGQRQRGLPGTRTDLEDPITGCRPTTETSWSNNLSGY